MRPMSTLGRPPGPPNLLGWREWVPFQVFYDLVLMDHQYKEGEGAMIGEKACGGTWTSGEGAMNGRLWVPCWVPKLTMDSNGSALKKTLYAESHKGDCGPEIRIVKLPWTACSIQREDIHVSRHRTKGSPNSIHSPTIAVVYENTSVRVGSRVVAKQERPVCGSRDACSALGVAEAGCLSTLRTHSRKLLSWFCSC